MVGKRYGKNGIVTNGSDEQPLEMQGIWPEEVEDHHRAHRGTEHTESNRKLGGIAVDDEIFSQAV
jgi:hypothetical protein